MLFEAIHQFRLEGGGVRETLVLVTSKSFSCAIEAEGRRCPRGMPQILSFKACLKAYKAPRAWALPSLPRGGGGLKGGLSALCNAI